MARYVTLALLLIAMLGASYRVAAEPAAEFLLKDLDGDSHNLAKYAGKVILLNFWSTWCADCKREVPSLVRLHGQRLPNLVILGVAVNDAEANVRAFAEQQKVAYPVLLDDDGAVADLYELEFIPTNVIVDADGEIHNTIVGFGTVAHFEASVLDSLHQLIPRPVEAKGKAAVAWAALKTR
ncbi:TlpA family protein disulfide reductase [Candidatus Poribacteria bacterium]|jgi:peroxiredoxin|nr:TlpA family protein disulfide reductase [Candidatus Poribacteria bacterium]MBT5535762.1 TlpA family protein disulfide reductase [Candidatus Poribacteria bacterium]MBT5711863.1 TlpA family protein disulfide reductase [Candidatus Poribacteria bacterium]MBT7100517.1 TlpA family protein disulfide reductase [Candidatus Poribacteria bacterium]MBT7806931.1 TlpA family protein disulfide reductase [Candidatus Poribacteria bacterium]